LHWQLLEKDWVLNMPITFNKDLILYNNNEVGFIRRNYNNDNYCAYLRSENFVTGYNTDNLEKILARMKKIGAVKNNNHIIFKANKFSQYEIYKLHNYIGFIQMPSFLFYMSSEPKAPTS
jgi:hypothetical protein